MKGTNITLTFYDFTIPPKTEGYKYVVFRIESQEGKFLGNDWGMAKYENGSFEPITLDDHRAIVVRWAEPPALDTIMKK